MKHKFSSMGRVAIALVLALSLSLVMAVPVAAIDTGFSVVNDPQTVGRAAAYTIDFTTAVPLNSGVGTIIITFPGNTAVGTISDHPDEVTVNGTACTTVVDDGSQVATITVPKDIPAGVVTVVIAEGAGILNPTTVATNWTVDVQTSAEPVDVTSAVYSTIAVVPPEIIEVAGTAYQNSNDTIVITFSELVDPEGDWIAAFPSASAILCGTTALVLTSADFSPVPSENTLTLTITLVETEAHLVNGIDNLKVTPVAGQIENVALDAHVAAVQKIGSVTGDTVAPAVALEYSPDRPVQDGDVTLTIEATFSEDMSAKPTITIVDAGSVTLVAAEDMTGSAKVWTYVFTIPAGSDGEATVTISGTDLAGNANQAATNATFVIDNTAPVVAVTGIVGLTTDTDTIAITFTEDVVAADGIWSAEEVTSIKLKKTGETDVTVIHGTAGYAYASNVLTITLAEVGATKDYLLNGYTLTFDPATDAIKDLAGNSLADAAVVGTTEVTGDLDVPTITGIVGVSTNTIQIAFSELVMAFDGEWSANEFSVESPDGAPLNITHAVFTNSTEATTVLIITLDTTDDAAVLVEGEVILVTPTADAVVDLAGNPLAADEETSGVEAGLLVTWVDVDWTNQADVSKFDPSLIWEANAWGTIQEGITAVAIGGTVNVAAGTYDETFAINKSLTLSGPNAAISPNTGTRVTEAIINAKGVSPAVDITADDVTVEGCTITSSTTIVVHSIRVSGGVTGAIISGNVIENVSGGGASQIALSGVSDCEVSDNLLTDSYILFDSVSTSNIIGNNVSGVDGAGCITIRYASTDIVIQDNSLSNGAAGIVVYDGASVEGIQILGNDITNNTESNGEGIAIGPGVTWGVNDPINNNNIYGNTMGIANYMASTTVDAENNWWGSAYNVDIAAMVSDNVDYSPWLDDPYPYGESTTTGSLKVQCLFELEAGWNLVSLPLIPTEADINTVLAIAGVDATVNKVAYYTGGPAGSWLNYISGSPGASDLTTMNDGKGYWIDVSAGGSFTATGVQLALPGLAPPTYDVVVGWNLIGVTGLKIAIEDYLGPAVSSNLEAIYEYSAGTYTIPTVLAQGHGYWLAVNAPGKIYP